MYTKLFPNRRFFILNAPFCRLKPDEDIVYDPKITKEAVYMDDLNVSDAVGRGMFGDTCAGLLAGGELKANSCANGLL